MKLNIDGVEVKVKEGTSILNAAQYAGIYIPTICYHPTLPSDGSCKLCIVEIEGKVDLPTSCTTPVTEDMIVHTNTPALISRRQDVLKRILAHHPCGCLTCWRRHRCQPNDICLRSLAVTQRCILCPKNTICELQKVADYVGLGEEKLSYSYTNHMIQEELLFVRDYNLCISCTRCVRMCKEVRCVEAYKMVDRNGHQIPQASDDRSLKSSGCVLCCACVEVCPTGALIDKPAGWEPYYKREQVISPCSFNCPIGQDAPLYLNLVREGKYADALGIIRETLPFPGVLGRVCIHPCEQNCRRDQLDKPVSIKAIKWFAAKHGGEEWKKYEKRLPSTGKNVAIVGSGPAGLTAAYYLAKQGHSTTVFEALPKAGGMMRVGIPRYRLPADVLDTEIDEIKRVGVEIKLNTKIESIDPLFSQGYDAVFLALGTHQGTRLGIEGEYLPGVADGVAFLRNASLDIKINMGEKVAVIGGGNVAIDAARTSLRLGAKEVIIVYRRTRSEMPASPEEVEAALEENIKILFLALPAKITKEGNRLMLTCNKMELGEPDASGRRRPVPIKGGNFSIPFSPLLKPSVRFLIFLVSLT